MKFLVNWSGWVIVLHLLIVSTSFCAYAGALSSAKGAGLIAEQLAARWCITLPDNTAIYTLDVPGGYSRQAAYPAAGKAGREQFEELLIRGVESMYNLEYEEGRCLFEEMVRLFPDHPAGPYYLAANLWFQALNQPSRLLPLFSNPKYFGVSSEDKAEPRTLRQFRELTRQAKLLAEARLKRNPRDAEALYFLGATDGLKAAFEGLIEGRVVAALRDGSCGAGKHREVLKIDPHFRDAELTIGIYDYVASALLPPPAKALAVIGGVRGSQRRGIETLRRVASEGRWGRYIAKIVLVLLFTREQRYKEAHALARELAAKFPRNYLFNLEAAEALISQAAVIRQTNGEAVVSMEREAFAIFDSLLRHQARQDAPAPPLELIHYRYGEALVVAGQPRRAAQEFLAAAGMAGVEQGFATVAHLRAAQSFDLAGERKEALIQYAIVLLSPKYQGAQREAQRGFREPYKNER